MTQKAQQIAVVGGGSWGTALVKVLQHNDATVRWWVRREAQRDRIVNENHNPEYLSYTELKQEKLLVSNRLDEVIKNSDLIIVAVPSAFLRLVFLEISPSMLENKIVISAVKGLEPTSSLPVYQWFMDNFEVPANRIGVIGGPCHSEEVVMQRLSYLTIGVFDKDLGEMVKGHLQTPYLKVRISEDVPGISMASVLKNVYGVLCGIASGLSYGDNFQAVLVANAISEMERILVDVSGNSRKINASAYTGDLLVTSYSRFSRNWMFGNLLGKGYPAKSALLELKMVAEGYYAVASLARMEGFSIAGYPLLNTVHRIIVNHEPADSVMAEITNRLC